MAAAVARERLPWWRRRWRQRAPYVVSPLVLALIVGASLVPDAWQGRALAVAAVIWVGVALETQVADADQRVVFHAAYRQLRRHPRRVGIAAALIASLPLIAAHQLAVLVPGGSFVGAVFALGVFLQFLVIACSLARAVLRRSRRADAFTAAAVAIALPFLPSASLFALRVVSDDPVPIRLWLAIIGVGVVVALFALVPVGVDEARRHVQAGRSARFERHLPVARRLADRVRERALPPPDRRFARHRAVLGAIAATSGLLASGAFMLAALRVPIERRLLEPPVIAASGGPGPTGPAEPSSLARFFAPVLRYDPRERWQAGRAEDFGPDPRAPHVESTGPRDVFSGSGLLYPAIIGARPAVDASSLERRTKEVLEYWIFYQYDEWNTVTALGRIVQEHEGDWEAVLIGLDADRRPLWVGYSAHCGGVWRPWAQVATVAIETSAAADPRLLVGRPRPGEAASHPLVYVARGSHANYPSAGQREPDWESCAADSKIADRGVALVSFAAAAREATPDLGPVQVARVQTPDAAAVTLTADRSWGRFEKIRLAGLLLTETDHGPESPSRQPLYRDPLGTVFHGADWRCDASARCS